MDLNTLIEIGITDELAKKVLELHKEKLKGFIPQHRLNEEIEKTKAEKERADELSAQIDELSQFKGTSEELKAQVATLTEEMRVSKEKYIEEMQKSQKMAALRLQLMTKDVPPSEKALGTLISQYNLDSIKLNDKGEITAGFKEQDETISKEFDFCYPNAPEFTVSGNDPDKKTKKSSGATEADAFFDSLFDNMIIQN